jgi:hypothetical protein
MAKRKKDKDNLKWIKQTLELKDNHNWSARPGCKVFVAGRGAVRFDVPSNWHFEPRESSFRFYDKKPPNEKCGLEVSYNLLPPADYSSFPLVSALKTVTQKDSRNVIEIGEVVEVKRQTARIVWIQLKVIDEKENREAHSRTCIGIGSGVQSLITFDYWAEDSDRLIPIWDTVIDSLVLGLFISDPRTGFAKPD